MSPQHPEQQKNIEQDSEAIKVAKEAWKQEKFEINGKAVEIYGVYHRFETLDLYSAELKSAIEKSGIVMLEYAPVASGLFSDSRVSDKLKTTPDVQFYISLENIAAKAGKMIATGDPEANTQEKDFEKLTQELDVQDNNAHKIKELITLGIPLGLVIEILRLRGELKQQKNKASGKDEKNSVMKRRSFLAASIGAVGVGAAAALSHEATYRDKVSQDNVGRKDNPLGQLLFELYDYRDVVAAEALNKLSEKKNQGPIVSIYGSFHLSALKHYALSPVERKAKLKLYESVYGKISKPKLSIYKPRKQSVLSEALLPSAWDKVSEESL